MSYHVPAARALFGEKQVLITNFRDPSERIRSCLSFRFAKQSTEIFNTSSFNISAALELLERVDKYGDSCQGEPFRILTPFNHDAAVRKRTVREVCQFVVAHFHIIFMDRDRAAKTISQIEADLHASTALLQLNQNSLVYSSDHDANMGRFVSHLLETSKIFQAEV